MCIRDRYVIHAVGQRYIDGQHEEETLLYSAYEAVFQLARENDIQTLAVPVLSAGIYQYPKDCLLYTSDAADEV
ncbi:macro domain-containing protein, partial [Enterococcus sp. S181_ASV_20]|nr:macro domain-containing protein [Enterococcus sp. S181_ASV_20]